MKIIIKMLVGVAIVSSMLTSCSKSEKMEAPEVKMEVKAEVAEVVDAVTTASIVTEGDALVKAVSAEGAWLAATLNDITLTSDLVIDGSFEHRETIDRKLALYAQDDKHVITAQYNLTAPKMIVKSPNFRITGGTFIGDVYVEADGFKLDKSSTVKGNIYFSTAEQLEAFTMDETAVLVGEKLVK